MLAIRFFSCLRIVIIEKKEHKSFMLFDKIFFKQSIGIRFFRQLLKELKVQVSDTTKA
jgi:hypothetical protein